MVRPSLYSGMSILLKHVCDRGIVHEQLGSMASVNMQLLPVQQSTAVSMDTHDINKQPLYEWAVAVDNQE